jgi:small basic protein
MFALTTDSIKSLGLGAVVVVVVLGVLAALLVQKVIAKVISLVVMAALALLLFNQRAAITDCANKVKAEGTGVVTGRVSDPTCTFFGFKVKVPLDKIGN